jgi:hypothetical protein
MYRWNNGPWVPGVTSIIGMLDKSNALVGWAKRETAASAIRNHVLLGQLIESGGAEAAIDWLKRIPDYIKDSAADLGTRVHYIAEQIGKGETPPDAQESDKKRAEAYLEWKQTRVLNGRVHGVQRRPVVRWHW